MNITSVNNERVKYWSKLKIKKFRDEEKKFLIEGDHLVNIALEKGLVLELITTNNDYDFDNQFIVSEEVMKKISNQVSISNVAAVCKYDYKKEYVGNIIMVDRLQDPGNLGTIIRSAIAFDFKTIILGSGTVDLYNEKTIRASEGMLFNINVVKEDLFTSIPKLKKEGYSIVGTDVNSGTNLTKGKIAIIIGNEGQGMDEKLKPLCDSLVHIPMNKDCESLNAGVAASILMYEVYHG